MRTKIQRINLLSAAGAVGAGAAHQVNGDRLGIYIRITGTATVKMETSADGVSWVDSSITGKTASGYFALDELHRFVRANVTAWTSGTVTVDLVETV